MKKTIILVFLSFAALIFVTGSLCAWSNGSIGLGQMFIQAIIGVVVEWFSLKNIEM